MSSWERSATLVAVLSADPSVVRRVAQALSGQEVEVIAVPSSPLLEKHLLAAAEVPEPMFLGDVRIEPTRHRLWCVEREVRFTAHEWRVLSCLVSNRTRAVSMAELRDYIWASAEPTKAYTRIQVYICYLRQKLSTSRYVSIRNVRGVGYQLVVSEEPRPLVDRATA
jgi:DNA-binding response OmpR family regulator